MSAPDPPSCGVINRDQMVRKTCVLPFEHTSPHQDKDGTTWPRTMKLTQLGDIANRYGVQTPIQFWTDLYSEISEIADHDGDWEQMVEERIAGLTEMRKRYYEIAARETVYGDGGLGAPGRWETNIPFDPDWAGRELR